MNVNDCYIPTYHKCANGATCVDGIGTYTCLCAPGWAGQFCDQVNKFVVVVEFYGNESLLLCQFIIYFVCVVSIIIMVVIMVIIIMMILIICYDDYDKDYISS